MSERFNFNYDPIRQGYDTNTWRTLTGSPAIGTRSRLFIDNEVGTTGSIVHYTDFVKGTITFNVNIPTSPTAGDLRLFGVSSLSDSKYIVFKISDVLCCEASNKGETTTSTDLDWNAADWNGEDLEFKIEWESKIVKFYIEGSCVYTIADNSVPYGPLSLYLSDKATSPMSFGDISVRGTQSIYVNPVTSDPTETIPG